MILLKNGKRVNEHGEFESVEILINKGMIKK